MRQRNVMFAVLAIAAAALGTTALVYARALLGDDRPPIIVRGGSIEFQGGDPDSANKTDCCNNWKKTPALPVWRN